MARFTTNVEVVVEAATYEEAIEKFRTLAGDHAGVHVSVWDGGTSDIDVDPPRPEDWVLRKPNSPDTN